MRHTIAFFLLALAISAFAQTKPANDVTLHLAQPDYVTPYGVPKADAVKADMQRVLRFLEQATPARLDGDKIHQGSFRLTSYEWGVTYAAMIDAAKASGDMAFLDYATSRLKLIAKQAAKSSAEKDPQLRSVLHPAALDDCGAMASALIRLQLSEGRDKASFSSSARPLELVRFHQKVPVAFDPLIERYVDYVKYGQMRLDDGLLARNRPYKHSIWLDDMYMGVPCLAWYGRLTGNAEYTDDAVRQVQLFKQRMWVPERQLFRHGWIESMQPHPAFHWGRANGWAILTLCEVLDAISESHAGRAELLQLLQQHAEGLQRLQDMTGFWHQLLDRSDTYLETSCTAIYCYCMAHAIRKGWLDAKAFGPTVLLAWNAVSTKINAEGQVEGTCVGTGMGFDHAFYAYRPVSTLAAHGYGPVIWAGSEILLLLQQQHPKMNDSAVQFYDTPQQTNRPIFDEE